MYNVRENDWKLLRKLVPKWQERYMDKLNKEYIQILNKDGNPSSIFWELEKRINKDKQHIGVVIDMRRSKMIENILLMLKEKVIFIEELEDFSNELKEEINYYLKMYGRGTM